MHCTIVCLNDSTDEFSLFENLGGIADYVDEVAEDMRDYYASEALSCLGEIRENYFYLDQNKVEMYLQGKCSALLNMVKELNLDEYASEFTSWRLEQLVNDRFDTYIYSDWEGLETIDSFARNLYRLFKDNDLQKWEIRQAFDYHC